YLNTAVFHRLKALDLTPVEHLHDRAIDHRSLGNIYSEAGEIETALNHHQKAIKNYEDSEDRYGAAATRRNAAITLANAGRLDEALLYCRAALRDFESLGPVATADIQEIQSFIARLEQSIEGAG